MIVLFMYAAGFALVGVQFTIADTFNITLTAYRCDDVTGVCSDQPIDSAIRGWLQEAELNERTGNIVSANFTTNSIFFDKIETFSTSAAFVAWELVTLMTGTYLFYILYLFGVHEIFVLGFLSLYILLLARGIIGYIRGI